MWSLLGLAVFLFLVLAHAAGRRRQAPTAQPLDEHGPDLDELAEASEQDNGRWVLGRGAFEGKPLVLRVRTDLLDVDRAALPHRLSIAWSFGDAGRDGMPSDKDLERLERFEDRLLPCLQADGNAVAVAVATTNGAREFIFYVSELDEASAAFHDEFGGDPRRLPVQLSAVEDPAWLEYDGMRENLRMN